MEPTPENRSQTRGRPPSAAVRAFRAAVAAASVPGRPRPHGPRPIELVGHDRVGLKEGVDGHLEGDVAEFLQQVRPAPQERGVQTGADLGRAGVDRMEDADHLGMHLTQAPHEALRVGQLARDRHQAHQHLAPALRRTHEQVASVSRPRCAGSSRARPAPAATSRPSLSLARWTTRAGGIRIAEARNPIGPAVGSPRRRLLRPVRWRSRPGCDSARDRPCRRSA